MKTIKPQDYYRILPLLKEVQINHLFARTVLEQKMDGEVFVNDLLNPTTFLVKHAYGMSLLWGRHDDEAFNLKLRNYLLNTDGRRTGKEFLQVFPSAWDDKLTELLGSRLINGVTANENINGMVNRLFRINFQFKSNKFVPFCLNGNTDFTLKQTNAEYFSAMKGTVIPQHFWRSDTDFVENGAGFSLVKNGVPASTAFSAFIHQNQLEIGIETLPQFHGQGLAPIVCSALIEYCIARGLEPVWACRLDNVGSYKLANKLGFEPNLQISYYQLSSN